MIDQGLRPIAAYAGKVKPGDTDFFMLDDESDDLAVKNPRAFELIGLGDFDFSHLKKTIKNESGEFVEVPDERAIAQLKGGLDAAGRWIELYQAKPGLSFVICGGVGTGKTTIAENLSKVYDRLDVVGGGDYDQQKIDDIDKLLAEGAISAETAEAYKRAMFDFPPINVPGGIMINATQLMVGDDPILADPREIRRYFERYKIIAIDDAGTEVIKYTNDQTFKPMRHKLYGNLFDYAYTEGKHLIITSMKPLLAAGPSGKKRFNPLFVEIFGAKAFSRLQVKAKGFMVDFSGLPDYREHQALEAVKEIYK